MNTFSIIIPVKPGGFVASYEHIKKNIPDVPKCEILLAEGNAPSQQRNRAAEIASGDILYFLDDDSLINIENFTLCIDGMKNPHVGVIGGPSLTPPYNSWLQQLFGSALSSAFGSGAVHNRYRAYGEVRETTDKELILCNLAVRRSVFMDLKGFNECLYPNEENEFIERVASTGYILLHSPSMYVYRSQRKTLHAFIRQMFSYGRGRGQQTLITASYTLTSFIPLCFVVYLVLTLMFIKQVLLLIPLVIYMFAAAISTIMIVKRSGHFYSLLLLGLYPLMHIVNGVGLFWGLLNGKPGAINDNGITVKIIKKFGEVI